MSRPNQFLSPEGDLEDYFVDEHWLIDQWVGDTLWSWGSNVLGVLGTNNTISRTTPVTTFAGGSNWKQISGGTYHIGAIKTDGTLWVWGSNGGTGAGKLATNNILDRNTPVTTFAGGTNWKQVSAANFTTAAIKTDGTLWVWAYNFNGQLGTNDAGNTNRSTPVTTFAGGTNWKQVSCGGYHTAAIKTDGTLWIWGSNTVGQLGDNTTFTKCTPVTTLTGGTNWKQVACGFQHSGAVKTDGTLWMWGFNSSGQIGDNTSGVNRPTPVTTFAGGNNWKQVACGKDYTAAIKTNGTLWMWGFNNAGQLGDNTTINKQTPVTTFAGGTNWKQVFLNTGVNSTGGLSTGVTKTDGTLWIWGAGGYGQLGHNLTTSRTTPITTFAGGTNWKQVSFGWQWAAAITSGSDPTFFIS